MTHTSQDDTKTRAEYVDDRELERRTPISRSRWQAMRYEKSGPPYFKVGRRVLYKWNGPDGVAAWIESQRVS